MIPVGLTLVAIGIIILAWGAWRKPRARRERGHVPGLPYDGGPLTRCEWERLDEIERGYGRAPRVMRRVR